MVRWPGWGGQSKTTTSQQVVDRHQANGDPQLEEPPVLFPLGGHCQRHIVFVSANRGHARRPDVVENKQLVNALDEVMEEKMNRDPSNQLDRSLILVGCGNMGYALLRGWVESSSINPTHVHVVEPDLGLRERAASLGVITHDRCETLPADADLIVIALKPQVVDRELPYYRRYSQSATFVSIAAGVTCQRLIRLVDSTRVARAMPNTPTAIGMGSTIIFCDSAERMFPMERVVWLFKAGGAVHQVAKEELIDAATAISGSGPAYVFYLIECLADAALKLGLPATIARALAKETVHGSAALAFSSNDAPGELRRQVTSPNGTTEAGLRVLASDDGLSSLILRTTRAAFERSLELALSKLDS
ncbi:pyrroline-5-carboxylate reductase [Rhizobium sullae]|nr:pyrroline-5-carboxylate reductase [Rhizobium sullae]